MLTCHDTDRKCLIIVGKMMSLLKNVGNVLTRACVS